MREATARELAAAYNDPRQLKLSIPEPPVVRKPDPLLKWRWLSRYFDRYIYLWAGGGEHLQTGSPLGLAHIRQFAAAIAYRLTLERCMAEYRAMEPLAVEFLDWCGLQDKRTTGTPPPRGPRPR